MAIGNQGRVLRIQQGQELQFHTSRDICCEYSLLNPAYQQAGHALIEILNHTKAFHEHTKNAVNKEKELFEYGGNIILFAASRGGGKTRMMMSFSSILEDSKPTKEVYCLDKADNTVKKCQGCQNPLFFASDSDLKECSFIVTEPIAPAALEKKQSILYVVLSRLYWYMENLLIRHYDSREFSINQRNELQRLFHNCLSGINGLKNPTDSMPEDFSVLQDISDGLSLRYHFHRLITKILEIAVPNSKAATRYLVLQIDDADSKIDGVYEVFEDIRKYLLVPNLVILMSADLDFLHHTITEEHLRCFDSLQKFDKEYAQEYSGELSRIARKYIDKLIPPSHQINLPELGKATYPDVKRIRLNYVNEKGEDILRDMKKNIDADCWTLETIILKLIYRKTGILFISPTAYLHNIIPRTLRGINQLLFILNSMKDIPEITRFNQTDFINDVLAQIAIAEHNLARFSEYFTHDWIKVKIKNSADRDFLNNFSNMANSSLTYMVVEHLKRKYKDVELPDDKQVEMNRYILDWSIQQCEKSHRTPEDFWLFFAIRTLSTLNSHRLVLHQKREQLQNFSKNTLVKFSFDEQKAFLTNCIELDLTIQSPHSYCISDAQGAYRLEEHQYNSSVFHQIMSSHVPYYDSYLNVFRLILQLGQFLPDSSVDIDGLNAAKISMLIDNDLSLSAVKQKIVYSLQEYSLTILCNWDVYSKLYRKTNEILERTQKEHKNAWAESKTQHTKSLTQTKQNLQRKITRIEHKTIPLTASQKEELNKLNKQLEDTKQELARCSTSTVTPITEATTSDKLKYLFIAIENTLKSLNNGTLTKIWPMTEIDSFQAFSTLITSEGSIFRNLTTNKSTDDSPKSEPSEPAIRSKTN